MKSTSPILWTEKAALRSKALENVYGSQEWRDFLLWIDIGHIIVDGLTIVVIRPFHLDVSPVFKASDKVATAAEEVEVS